MEQWSVSYRKPGGIFVQLGLWRGDMEVLALRFHPESGRPLQPPYPAPQDDATKQMQTLERPIQSLIQRVLKQRREHVSAGESRIYAARDNWELVSVSVRTIVSPPKLYGYSMHECHFVLMKKE